MDEKRLDNIEMKVNDMHKALIGDNYGNNGYQHRINRLEKFCRKWEQMMWMVAGGAAVISVIINIIWKVI